MVAKLDVTDLDALVAEMLADALAGLERYLCAHDEMDTLGSA
jgi:hypothetical protein